MIKLVYKPVVDRAGGLTPRSLGTAITVGPHRAGHMRFSQPFQPHDESGDCPYSRLDRLASRPKRSLMRSGDPTPATAAGWRYDRRLPPRLV